MFLINMLGQIWMVRSVFKRALTQWYISLPLTSNCIIVYIYDFVGKRKLSYLSSENYDAHINKTNGKKTLQSKFIFYFYLT